MSLLTCQTEVIHPLWFDMVVKGKEAVSVVFLWMCIIKALQESLRTQLHVHDTEIHLKHVQSIPQTTQHGRQDTT